jgi:hypothetical protein
MAGALVGAAAAVGAAIVALAGPVLGTGTPSSYPVTSFGGPRPVHVAQVGHIEVDLEPSGAAELHRVACAGVSPGTACYISK